LSKVLSAPRRRHLPGEEDRAPPQDHRVRWRPRGRVPGRGVTPAGSRPGQPGWEQSCPLGWPGGAPRGRCTTWGRSSPAWSWPALIGQGHGDPSSPETTDAGLAMTAPIPN